MIAYKNSKIMRYLFHQTRKEDFIYENGVFKFIVWFITIHIWRKQGTGTIKKAYGVSFSKKFVYK